MEQYFYCVVDLVYFLLSMFCQRNLSQLILNLGMCSNVSLLICLKYYSTSESNQTGYKDRIITSTNANPLLPVEALLYTYFGVEDHLIWGTIVPYVSKSDMPFQVVFENSMLLLI